MCVCVYDVVCKKIYYFCVLIYYIPDLTFRISEHERTQMQTQLTLAHVHVQCTRDAKQGHHCTCVHVRECTDKRKHKHMRMYSKHAHTSTSIGAVPKQCINVNLLSSRSMYCVCIAIQSVTYHYCCVLLVHVCIRNTIMVSLSTTLTALHARIHQQN